jgi:putative protease
MSSIPLRKPEVMSPAGYWPQLRAAIEAGADSVYFGLHHFTARAKVGFSPAELPEVMATLHRRGVKGFVTFNTLIFEHELHEAGRALAAIAEAGADAIIVQDVAAARMVREIAPWIELHASTQMSVTSVDGVRLAESIGASRVTLARELSLDEIRAIRAATDCELEIFVHGALCVAYSGQCFSSEAWGGRSANRGQCAQACRLPYDLIVDGKIAPLGDARYLLSPGDLFALKQIPEIVPIGISALKIEGRYKDADYVALTTRAYREAVDAAWQGVAPKIDRTAELEQVYSRGLGPYFLTGTDHQAVVKGRAPRHRGVLRGRVVRAAGNSVWVENASSLKPGDGIVFDAADWRSPEEPEEGGRIYEIDGNELRFGNGVLNAKRIRRGDLVWRTHDPEIDKAARPFLEPAAPLRKQPVTVRVKAQPGAPLHTEWSVGETAIAVESETPLSAAQNRALDRTLLESQFARLGNTPYELAGIEAEIEGTPFAPASLLNEIRRQAVDRLQQAQSALPKRGAGFSPRATSVAPSAPLQPPQLHLLVRTPEQLESALELAPASITLDYLDLYGLRPSLDRVRAAGIPVRVASPRVLKPGESRIVDFLLSCNCPILVRPAGILDALRSRPHPPLVGDFSLNIANSVAAGEFLALGIERFTPTHDLNAAQIAQLARDAGADRIEAIAYQHLPVFHTEHCVFCRFLSSGTSYRDCGRPCESHVVSVRDPAGRAHPVLADVGCRNTVFGAEAQEASRHLEEWLTAGIRHFRLEYAHESGSEVSAVTAAFADALSGRRTFRDLAQQLPHLAPRGVTQGSLFVPEGYLTLPVLQ